MKFGLRNNPSGALYLLYFMIISTTFFFFKFIFCPPVGDKCNVLIHASDMVLELFSFKLDDLAELQVEDIHCNSVAIKNL